MKAAHQASHRHPRPGACGPVHLIHHVVCRHQIEVEIWPPRAELYFRDERFVHPIDTQIRFESIVYNASNHRVIWEVRDLAGNSGLGTIDESGVYQAPLKGGLNSGHTEVIIATSYENPLRKASAWVTLLGEGPEPAPLPKIAIWPRKSVLYYPGNTLTNHQNELIDESNKIQLFEAKLWNVASPIDWLVDEVVQASNTEPWFLYKVIGSGSTTMVSVKARIHSQPAVVAEAKILQINYLWPKMKDVSQL